ncbi:PadR family transcriptional regulator [Bacillus mangrovi]|uniref:PadR family transcriptional regulator n=1 Tax=Metabacillus mangrovi TaxID=1491830 RepID=A0A7X2V4P0_9BACI|nr:PadR family transcriptional regulator [Metabacillus mangrovi]MTH53982.1 PadR family transcriptional regulator [Metabacillus mangrovi]
MSVKLVILGLLMEGNKHPYEIQQVINERQMKHYIKLASGSLYYAFETLGKDGFVKVVDVVSDTKRPDKTIYAITEAGEAEFEKLFFEQLLKKEHMYRPVYASLSFTSYIDQDKLERALKGKIEETETTLKKMKRLYAEKKKTAPLGNLSIIMRVILHLKAELGWFQFLHEAADAGKISKIDEDAEALLEEFEI